MKSNFFWILPKEDLSINFDIRVSDCHFGLARFLRFDLILPALGSFLCWKRYFDSTYWYFAYAFYFICKL